MLCQLFQLLVFDLPSTICCRINQYRGWGGAIFIYCQLFRGSQGHNLLDLQVLLMIYCFIILWRCKSVGERYPQNQPKLSIPKSKDSTLLLIYNWNLQTLKYDHQKMNYEPEYHMQHDEFFFFHKHREQSLGITVLTESIL